MTPEEVIRDHKVGLMTSDGWVADQCAVEGQLWPCDAYEMARQLRSHRVMTRTLAVIAVALALIGVLVAVSYAPARGLG